jgi:dynactin 1
MVSMNLRLQSSASKYQAKNIELELKRLEARESKELLAIVQVCFRTHHHGTC